MRDIIITLVILGSLPMILRHAYIGVLVWSWISYMNPHKLTWGFALNMPFAQIVAVTMFIALIMNNEKKRLPINGLTVTWLIFLAWMIITTFSAFYFDEAFEQLVKIYKIQLVTFITLLLITNQDRLNLLIWVIVVSIGYFSTKGGLFTIVTGGGSRVWGPPGGYIEENNALAVATLMVIPLMVYLQRISKEKWVRMGLTGAIVLSLASALGSQSRGALLAFIAVAFFFWLKTKSKIVSGAAIVVIALVGFTFMPQSWHDRMDTIENYQEDQSAMGRINAWTYAINVANDRFTGAGLQSWSYATFVIYAPNPNDVHAAHSIYFSALADHGWPGLVMFLIIFFLGWRYLGWVIRNTTKRPELSEQNLLARMLQVSLIAYASGGAFLSLTYFDLPWHILAITILLREQVKSVIASPQESDMALAGK